MLERGRTAIETIVRMIMLTGVPTVVEFVLILAVFLLQFDWRYALAVTLMIVVYMVFTTLATNWRIAIRQSMNESDQDANTKAIDSLLNFETVKYFGAEAREAARYDRAMARYERLSTRTYTSLAVLNAGQAVIFSAGLAVVMAMSIAGIRAGRNTVGDFVLINAMMIQLYQPLNFMGLVYREVKQAIIDIESMFDILDQAPRCRTGPMRAPLVVTRGPSALRGRSFPLRSQPRDPAGASASRCRRARRWRSSARRAPASRPSRACCSASTRPTAAASPSTGRTSPAVTQASLRDAIGMVPQDTVLFNDTHRLQHPLRPLGRRRSGRRARRPRLAQIDALHRQRARTATAPRWASAASSCRAARSSASPSPAPS